MPPRRLSALAVALCAAGAAAEPPPTAVIVNLNHSRQLGAASGPSFLSFPKDTIPQAGRWLGLYCEKSACEVREADLAVMGGTIANCDGQQNFAESVYAFDNPVALFHGVNLPLGKVTTSLLATKAPAASRHYGDLRRAGQWQVKLNGKPFDILWLRMEQPKTPDQYLYRFYLSDGKTKQFIFSTSGPKAAGANGIVAPFVHWAGDLDWDGRLDLLVEIPYGLDDAADAQCQVSYRLYLSSQAQEGEVAHKAAQTSGVQPACACRKGRERN